VRVQDTLGALVLRVALSGHLVVNDNLIHQAEPRADSMDVLSEAGVWGGVGFAAACDAPMRQDPAILPSIDPSGRPDLEQTHFDITHSVEECKGDCRWLRYPRRPSLEC
jgi:hypothetical protein